MYFIEFREIVTTREINSCGEFDSDNIDGDVVVSSSEDFSSFSFD